jgi:CheY-like chemotaxis protein
VLERHGYRVLSVPGGIEAISLFTQNQDTIRCVVTDVMMPTLDGIAFGNIIRHMNSQLPIIFATGLAEDGKLRAVESFGPLLLRKPYSGAALLQVIKDSLVNSPISVDLGQEFVIGN